MKNIRLYIKALPIFAVLVCFSFLKVNAEFKWLSDTVYKSPEKSPKVENTNAQGQALWALGVQIGFAEMGSHQNVSSALLRQSLQYAYDAAISLPCIPYSIRSRIASVRNKMQATSSSRSLYNEILRLRIDMGSVVASNCQCAGSSSTITPPPSNTSCRLVDWAGTWKTTYGNLYFTLYSNGNLSGYYGSSKYPIYGRAVPGNPCIIEGTWKHKAGGSTGRFRFVMKSPKKFEGRWTYGNQSPVGSNRNWNGSK